MSAASPAVGKPQRARSGGFILGNLAVGHAITHWYGQSLFVILPYIQASLGFSNVEFGILGAVRQVSSGVANVPSGFIIDMAKKQWGMILTGCMWLAALSFGLMAITPSYLFLVGIMILVALPGTIWHMPAIAAISQRMPERRGFGLSIHGMGGNVGNFIGPLVAGALLGIMSWRGVALIYIIPAIAISVVVWVTLRDIGTSDRQANEAKPLKERIGAAAKLLATPAILMLMFTTMLRNAGFNSLLIWTPKYFAETVELGGLGMTKFEVGLHVAFLTGLGVLSAPILGLWSDKYGRKVVLVPGLLVTALLGLAIGYTFGIVLSLVVLVVGLFTYALAQILQATVLDQIDRGTEGSAMGLILGSNSAIAAVSPIIGAFIVDAYGLRSVFAYNAALIAVSALLLMVVPLKGVKLGSRRRGPAA